MPVFLLSDNINFPPPHFARKDGLLAIGGDLSQERLLLAYRKGIFPWYSNGEPILWWSPDPRLVLYPKEFYISRSLKKSIRKGLFQITMDQAFFRVIKSCAEIRLNDNQPTWIVPEMINAYCQLHESGFAHSVEAWYQGKLAGGLYGLALGKCFSGESMFTRVTDASKVAFVYLVSFLKSLDFQMIDCQVKTSHLMSFGAREIPRKTFLQQLEKALHFPQTFSKWNLNADLIKELIMEKIRYNQ
jgi:leucyl/phenylalanyl-tRNA---protein transferase